MMKKVVIFSSIVLIMLCNINSQQLIKDNGVFKYFVGKTEPPSNWKEVSFDDSSWQSGDSTIIGYGWPASKRHLYDSIVVDTTTSLYLRSVFYVEDKNTIRNVNLLVDFDDGFVAYLNGHEIARANLGKKGEDIYYDRLTDRSHEAYKYRSYYNPVNGIFIDSAIIKNYLINGTNILAVQVHNDSVKGSDLSFLMNLFNLDERNYNYYDSQFRYYRQIDLESSKFPIVFIETDEYDIPVKNVRVQATMSIIDNNTGVNKITDPISFTSRISIERRGESSADFPKMSYNIETQDELGNNLDVELMGMPADNDWVLFSSFADKSLIRTELTYLLFARMDHYAPRTRYCELIYNGQYMGLYYFMEKIKRGKDRVDVAKRDTTNPEEGGFIFKYDKPTRKAIQFVYPKKDEVTTKEKTYITNFVKEFENVLKSDKFLDLEEGYRKYVSGKSLVDYVIINELSKNCDAYLFSTYFHKNKNSKDGRIKYGPPWDYDIAYGDAVFQEGNLTSKWQFEFNTDLQIKLLFRDTTLTHALSRRWWTLRSNLLSNENIMHLIDSLCTDIYESRVLNFQVWPIIDKYLFYPPYLSVSYDNEIQITKDWITKRLKWIDENIDNIYYPLDISAPTFAYSTTAIDLYPNPFNNYLKLHLIGESGKYDISIAGMDGKIYLKKSVNCIEGQINNITFSGDELSLPASGMYFIIVSHNGRTVQAEKIIKQ